MAQTRTLQVRYVKRDQTVAAGVAQATPVSAAWDLGKVILERLRIRLPPGHAGLTGLAILYSGVPIVPSEQPGVFLVGDDEVFETDVNWEISGPLTLSLFNTDIYSHTFYLAATVRDIALVAAGTTGAGTTVLQAVPETPGPSDQQIAEAIGTLPPVPADEGTP